MIRKRDLGRLGMFVAAGACALATLPPAAGGADKPPRSPARLIAERSGFPGGLCVFVGAGDSSAAIELGKTGRFLVQVLDADANRVDTLRREIRRAGLYGLVTAEPLPSATDLPYTENLVNVVVLPAPGKCDVPMAEVARVLCPRGVVLIGRRGAAPAVRKAQLTPEPLDAGAGDWTLARKPRPKGMDGWTHRRHSAAGNAVSNDKLVAPPRRVRWVAGATREICNLVTAAGRSYYGGLWARDSFNGLRLWDRPLKPSPAQGNYSFRKTPGSVHPVAVGERVLVVTDGKLAAVDGATGKTVRRYDKAGTPTEVLCTDGTIVAVDLKSLGALDVETGAVRWRRATSEPQYTVAGEGGVFFLEGAVRRGEGLTATALELDKGTVRWQRSDYPFLRKVRRLVVARGLVVFEVSTVADKKEGNAIHVADAANGRVLWSRTFVPGANHMKQARAMIVGETLWVLEYARCVGLDPRTGSVRRVLPAGQVHCFPPVATARYMISGELDLTDLQTGAVDARRITKAACGRDAGWVPANGLIYFSPKHCVCWPMLRGYVALAPRRPGGGALQPPKSGDFRPAPGPARPPDAPADADEPWPCYRKDAWRSGGTTAVVKDASRVLWTASLGGRPDGPIGRDWRENPFVRGPVTPPVIAGGRVYVARPDAHEVVALDADTGTVRWRASANGRVDTPPTIHRGLCLFGTSSGWVVALRADDGRCVWRLHAAPREERIVAYGQVESPWPIAGSVLVADDVAYFAAGRHALADGGILVFAVTPANGHVRWVRRLESISPIHGRKYRTDPNDPRPAATHTTLYSCNAVEFDHIDLLHREGKAVAMSRWLFDRATGRMADKSIEAFALLKMGSRGVVVPRGAWSYAPRNLSRIPRGEIPTRPLAVYRDGTLFGCLPDRRGVYRRDFTPDEAAQVNRKWITGWAQSGNARKKVGEVWRSDRLSPRAAWKLAVLDDPKKTDRITAMALAADKLLVVSGRGTLLVLSADEGKLLARHAVPPPVWNGLAIGKGRLFLSTQDGKVLCLGPAKDAGGPS